MVSRNTRLIGLIHDLIQLGEQQSIHYNGFQIIINAIFLNHLIQIINSFYISMLTISTKNKENQVQPKSSRTMPKKSILNALSQLQELQFANIELKMQIHCILGTNQSKTKSGNIYAYNNNEILYYVNNQFIKYHICSKKYQIFNEQGNSDQEVNEQMYKNKIFDHVREENNFSQNYQSNLIAQKSQLIVTKYFPSLTNSVVLVIKKIADVFYLSVFWTQFNVPTLYVLSENLKEVYTNCTFNHKKGYVYLLYKLKSSTKFQAFQKQQYLKIIQIQTPTSFQSTNNEDYSKNNFFKSSNLYKMKILLNSSIRKTGGGISDLDDLTVADDPSQLYLYGLDYFRQWKILYNQKAIKESNYRNIERNIKKQRIVNIFWINQSFFANFSQKKKANQITAKNTFNSKIGHNYLIIITEIQVLFVQNNQLLSIVGFPDESIFRRANQETAEMILQKSLNQIYKTKFRVQHSEPQQDSQVQQNEGWKINSSNVKRVTSASNCWIEKYNLKEKEANSKQKQGKVVKFCASNDYKRTIIYKIQPDFTIKVQGSINKSFYREESMLENHQNEVKFIKNISVSNDGSLIILTDSLSNNYINNRTINSQSNEVDPIYNAGHGHVSQILSISAPQVVNMFTTVSIDGCLKIWNKDQRERSLMIDAKFKLNPLQAIMHPCGFLVMVNFGFQIKIYGIISNQLEEIVSIKTNDFCSSMDFCKQGNFLVTNEKNIIKLYDPFTFHVFNKIQPDDLRLQFKKVKISENGEYIVYQCCNQKVYRLVVSTYSSVDLFSKNKYEEIFDRQQNSKKYNNPIFCHRQSDQYTCFYFNFGSVKSANAQNIEQKSLSLCVSNIFIGFSKTKFMTVYSNYGENLIAQFPIVNGIYVTNYCLTEQMIFLGTNLGTIIVYKWPILQSHFEVQILTERGADGSKIGHYKLPKPFYEFKVWKDTSPITVIHRISNKNQLIVGGVQGLLAMINYNFVMNGQEVTNSLSTINFSVERKRMIQSMNNIKFMKISEIQKISKLIQKTQNDIQKIEHQTLLEKQKKNKQLSKEQQELKCNMDKRKKAYSDQRNQKFILEQKQVKKSEQWYKNKRQMLTKTISNIEQDFNEKKNYEKSKIQQIKNEASEKKAQHIEKIKKLIQEHKSNIRNVKEKNLSYIKQLQKQFQNQISSKQSIQNGKRTSKHQEEREIQLDIQNELQKVQQLEINIKEKQKQVEKISAKVSTARNQDEQAQHLFQKNLEKYNQLRYQNLVLHSELLKIQNQLYERNQILSKKDQVIKMAYQEKSINQTYKQYASGTIIGLESQKQKSYEDYIKKQQDLRMLFDQLTLKINKSENKKLKLAELKQAIRIQERQQKEKNQYIKLSVQKLKNLKKYLLVQGVSDDSEHKRFYQEQEKLLTSIRWLQKRFKMNCINEKKLTMLKKSGVGQVINQNKNLLEECNQLRQQGIIYENEIQHLSKKLAQANKIIELEKKLKNQKNVIVKQTEDLAEIRKLFSDQIEIANKDLNDNEK